MNYLSEISDKFRINVYCTDCDRRAEIDFRKLIQEQGDMTVKYFRTKVRCLECGIRTEDIRIGYVGTTAFGYRDH